MRRIVILFGLVFGVLLAWPVPALAAPPTVEISIDPGEVDTVLGGEFTIMTEIRNTGTAATGPLLAHLSVASLQGGVYVDPEDWSPARSQDFSLRPGESRTLTWNIQAVNAGSFAAYIVVVPYDPGVAGQEELAVSPLVALEVAPRTALGNATVLPLVIGLPVALGLLALGVRGRERLARVVRRPSRD
jgi:hypothetical protein